MMSCYFDHKMSKCRTNVLRSYPGLPSPNPLLLTSKKNRLKHIAGQYFRILSSNFSISSYFLGITVVKPEIRAKTRAFSGGFSSQKVTMIAIDLCTPPVETSDE